MARYRFTRTLPTGWRIRLDYIPWDGSFYDAITEVDDVALVEVGKHTVEFDDLPFGMIEPQTLKLRLAFNRLPSALQAYLRAGRETTTPQPAVLKRNVFVLYSDRGTGGVTWTTEFVGCEDDVEGFDVAPGPNDVYFYDVELVDVIYHATKSLTGNDAFLEPGGIAPRMPSTPLKPYHKLFYVLLTNLAGRNQFQTYNLIRYMSLEDVMTWMSRAIRDYLDAYYLHGLGVVDISVTGLVDMFTTALELKSSTYFDYDRVPDATLTASTAYLTTHAFVADGPLDDAPGGLLGSQDKYGWGRDDVTVYDILKDLSEAFGLKMTYNLTISNDFVITAAAAFTPRRVASPLITNTGGTGYDAQVGALQMVKRPQIGRGQNNIAKAEARWESEYSEDVKDIMRLRRGADGSRSINVEPILHNVPTYLPESDRVEGREGPFLQTNQIWGRGTGDNATTLILAHENTRYHYTPAGAYVQATTIAGQKPPRQDNEALYRIQLNSVQAEACMPYTLTQFLLHVFANPDNATIEAPWSALKTSVVLPAFVGAVYDLSTNLGGSGGTADFADVLPNLAWSKAILMSSTHNWMTGEVDTKFFLMAATGNVG